MEAVTETFEVQETKPLWAGEKPSLYILINGKMSYVPHRWEAKPGDIITITRRGQAHDTTVETAGKLVHAKAGDECKVSGRP